MSNQVTLKGWIERVRELGGLKFFILRNRDGVTQVTLKKGVVKDELFDLVGQMHREDCLIVRGELKDAKQAPGGKELVPDSIEVVNKAETPLPIELGETNKDKRLDYRYMDLRDHKVLSVFKVRSEVLRLIREYYANEGFFEVQTPVIQAAGAEGGSELFPIIYYGKEAFLKQSPQLYKQMLMASGLDKIWEIGNAFRAEKFHTRKHISEITMVDTEMAWIESEEDVMRVVEGLVHHVLKGVSKNCKDQLELLGATVNVPELPFPRLHYDEVLKMLDKEGVKLEWGSDFGDAEERRIGDLLAKKGTELYFFTKYPSQIKPFYVMMDGKYSRGFDLDFKGMEITSGGQREHRLDILTKIMKSKGLDPHKFEFYLNAFKYGMPAHGGFGLGADRVVQQILNLPDIKEVVLFPRTTERLVP
ncbi:MAG: aspartate--tRNA(Asn) ligase [Candidatus Aenigmarchaeota archaeon]|nr:aspartate--tRNA(Asn) ligase [Candidatus Aenigmarchaeota archaeon]